MYEGQRSLFSANSIQSIKLRQARLFRISPKSEAGYQTRDEEKLNTKLFF